jgi:uncharacterized protein YdaU (DUF1376 family)
MPEFYKMDPALWDVRTSNLTLEQEAAYLRIVNAIHKHKSPVPNNDRVLAGMFRVSTRKARALVNALIDAGKITLDGDYLTNERAVSDLVHRGFVSVSMAENGEKGGRTRAENAAKSLNVIDTGQATASIREEKRREEYTEAKASDGQAVLLPVPDDEFASGVWTRGVAFLARHGVPERQARSFIGKLRKDHSDAEIFAAFSDCSKAGAVDPIPWITRALTPEPVFKASDLKLDLSNINPDGSLKRDTATH